MIQKVLYIHHTTAIGGATNSLLYTIEQLPKSSFVVDVLFLQGPGPASNLFKQKSISIKHLNGVILYQHAYGAKIKWTGRNPLKPITQFFGMLLSIARLKRFINQNYSEYKLVHINTSVMLPVGIACKLLGKKIVWHNREVLYSGFFGLRRYIVSSIIKICADKIIHISKMGMKSVGNSAKSKVIYNFVDFNKFNRSLPRTLHDELQLSSNIKIITMLGGTVHSKGADVFLKALPLVLKKFPNVHFVIAGYPPQADSKSGFFTRSLSQKCLDIIEQLDIKEKATFLGLRNDIPSILSSSHILVWPATLPHFSRPIIEAQAMGIPAIGTHFKVTEEVIEEGRTGLTFENRNEKSLANQINALLQDENLWASISKKSFQQAKDRFSAENNIKQILTVYQSLL